MDIEALSLPELVTLRAKIDPLIEHKKVTQAQQIKAEFDEKVKASGLQMTDIFGEGPNFRKSVKFRATHGPVEAKYRDPESGKTWSGRGRTPLWMPKNKAARERLAV